jgi:ring-1,2-phenylacetyl-CoA epoxidase subunit PaaC
MTPIESFESLTNTTREAVIDLLYRLADDDIIMGHRDSEWTGLAPILEEDIAFSSMAQDKMGHALMYYQMLHALGEPDPDTLAFGRRPRQFRCASLVSLPNSRDWAFCLMRQFLYDAAGTIRLAALSESTLVPLAQLARKLRSEKKYHLLHGRTWVIRLGQSTDDARARMQKALDGAYPHALGLFEPTEADEVLAQAGIAPHEEELCSQWASAVVPVLRDAGLTVPETVRPAYGGRSGQHPEALTELLSNMQLVYSIDPSAKW